MSQIVLFGNGVQTRFALPATSVQIESVVFSGVGPAWSLVDYNVIAFESPMPIDMQAAVEYTDLGSYGGSGSGGGLTEEQYDNLVQDTELSAVEQNLLNNAGAVTGEVRMFTTLNGQAPGGWAKSSGFVIPSGLFTLNKFAVTNGMTAISACSSTKAFRLVSSGTNPVYDYGTGQNSTYPAGPWAAQPGAVLANDQFVYSFGAASGTGAYSSAYRLNQATGVWTNLPGLPTARNYALSAEQADGQIVVFGGSALATTNAADLRDTVYRYNPSTGVYATLTPLPFRAHSGYACRKANGQIFAIWSQTSDGTVSLGNRAALFDPTTGVSTQLDNPGFSGPVFELSDGRVAILNQANPANSVAYDGTQPSGSRYVAYSFVMPTGVTSLSTFAISSGFTRLVQGSLLPTVFSISGGGAVAGVLWTTATPSDFLGSFYAVKQ